MPAARCWRAAEPVRRKYAWPKWEETFEDPVTGRSWTFRQIVQGMIDNFLGRESEWRWRLNDEVRGSHRRASADKTPDWN